MGIGSIIEIALFAILAIVVILIIGGAIVAIPNFGKGKRYRYSKNGDAWIMKYKPGEKSKAY